MGSVTEEAPRRRRPPAKNINDAFRQIMADVPRRPGGDLEAIVAEFKAQFPEEWEALRLCPLEYGIEIMTERMA